MNDRLDRLYELSDSHSTRAAHAESEAGRDFAELSGNHDALRYRERERETYGVVLLSTNRIQGPIP